MPHKFEIGDVVRLKSGGPTMTIDMLDCPPGWVMCVWYDNDLKHFDTQFFSSSALYLAPCLTSEILRAGFGEQKKATQYDVKYNPNQTPIHYSGTKE